MPYWIASLLIIGTLAVLLFAFAIPIIALWVLPVVAAVLVAIGVARALQARRTPREEDRA